jgi:hypothetical protein
LFNFYKILMGFGARMSQLIAAAVKIRKGSVKINV